jgi:hypothetical protein
LVIVGAGPRTTGLLERLATSADQILAGEPLTIHVVDPFPAGAGRVWRVDQSPLMWMNSRAAEVTMFTDESVTCAGPVVPGPTLYEWAVTHGVCGLSAPELTAEARSLTPDSFASRRLAGEYLRWCFHRAVRSIPPNVHVASHLARAVSVHERPDGMQVVVLSNGRRIRADLIVLAQGNIDGCPDKQQRNHRRFAARHGGAYLPPACTADMDLSVLPAGRHVIVSGLGLAFIDMMVLLTEERGGTFGRGADGRLRYRPSGSEPVLWVGSRRGVPYLPKPDLRLLGGPVEFPRFVTQATISSALVAGADDRTVPAPAGAGAALWGDICKEIGWGYYHELFTAHPDRTQLSWRDFAAHYSTLGWADPRLHELVAAAVPDRDDHLDLDVLRSPLAGLTFAGEADLARWMRQRILRTVRRATDRVHSAEAGAFHALVSVGSQLSELALTKPLDADAGRLLGRLAWLSAFIGSGPPPYRLEQLCALSDAGVVRFLGANLAVTADPERKGFVARTDTLGVGVRAPYVVEARLPASDIRHGGDPLLARMVHSGRCTPSRSSGPSQLVVDSGTYQVVSGSGRNHPRIIGLGAFATSGGLGSFARPATNAPFFRQNDTVARWILTELSTCRAVPRR